MCDELTVNPLTASGRWADLVPSNGFDGEQFHAGPTLAESQADLNRFFPGKPLPSLDDEIFSDPRYNIDVLWIKRTYRVGEVAVREAILKAFEGSGLAGVEIVNLYISTSPTRDRAYLVLNSAQAVEMLLNGAVSIVVRAKASEEAEGASPDGFSDVTLWVDLADHLVPTEDQDRYTLYIWQLPTDLQAIAVEEALRRFIEPLCPIYRIEVKENNDGRCGSWAKVAFKYEDHTRKCIYMMNYNVLAGKEIRAAFYQTNAAIARSRPAPREDRGRQADRKASDKIPRQPRKDSNGKITKSTDRKPRKSSTTGNTKKPQSNDKNGWSTVRK